MTDSFNGLTPAQAEVLALLSEEAAEVIQAVQKIMRHGINSVNPTKPFRSNIQHLCKELGDLAVAKALCSKYIYGVSELDIEARQSKLRRIDRWLHHASAEGILPE